MSSSIFSRAGSLRCGSLPLGVSAIVDCVFYSLFLPSPWTRRGIKRGAHSDVEVADVERVLLDELAARLDLVAHQLLEHLLSVLLRTDLHAQHRARLRIHRGLPQLLRVHLAQTLVALDLDSL